eukprot:SAG11_NODE_11382_length_764_cov_1.326316_1_plen_44_part_10
MGVWKITPWYFYKAISNDKYLHDPRKTKILEDLDPGFKLVDPVP